MDSSLQQPPLDSAGLDLPMGFAGKCVLVVDDNEINQLVAAGLLTDAGASVRIATSGPEAMAALQARAYDVVLMDVQMPGMDGFQATREIRSLPHGAAVPIVAMTAAQNRQADRERCLEAGMDDFVAKPLDVRELFEVLARWTARACPAGQGGGTTSDDGRCISFSDGLRRCLGRLELYDRIARRFLDTRIADAQRTTTALAQGNRELARKLAHDLTSTAGTLGAERLSAAALALQVGLDEGAHAAVLSMLLNDYTAEHTAVVALLQSYAAGDIDLGSFAQRK